MRWDWDYLWHVLGGFGVCAAVLLAAAGWHAWLSGPQPPPWLGWFTAGGVFCFGVVREQIQHDGRLTLHRWIEGITWGVGALAAAILLRGL